ncbi:glycosyltransferase family 2 protein [Anoxybacillus flavithermus]|uniref:glycosyltransferase family 2 protein n=1 Tax=Anoxybacillus flavithermus TaxID=33934 RepID=UPI0010094242|nr:glycosyltransferase family 2 protein [Anoxybacillus flavithermus]QAV25733.1 glycosyl transferase family 2 [Neobacillus thermocopriae]MBE2940079.1 glycosyltransferase family 2 protein [Anoxybacillus flavithermus]MBE2942832.1 glycosyltransferase family 2 protein [Anoxybacillus flavithermus]MBE2951182.1 glycosyltransferase family 2 protein [Anoxybacillus flavithermus]MBE2953820.1 glycosyltransferase family 2 protein [Anoxybacillus flavithermus]
MDISIIIVNYNTPQLTVGAIESILKSKTKYEYEIIVVDNHSSDDSVHIIKGKFPGIVMIENKKNVGFSKANNQAIKLSKGRYILLLNSDTIVNEDTIEKMIEFMDKNKEVGASGCQVVLPSGELDRACHRGFPTPEASFYYLIGLARLFPKSPRFNRYHLGYMGLSEPHPVDCLVGAFMVVRREVIEQVGLLDEQFFMYGEDIDWCYRIKKVGWEIYYYPFTTIIHYKGGSSRRKPFKIIYEFHRAMFLFHRKHYADKYPLVVNGLVYTGILCKFILSVIVNIFRKMGG